MGNFKLYETEWLVYVERGFFNKYEYWVLRREGVSPLFTRHRVHKRHVAIATALFKDHPDGIRKMELEDLRYLEGEKWSPSHALDHVAQADE